MKTTQYRGKHGMIAFLTFLFLLPAFAVAQYSASREDPNSFQKPLGVLEPANGAGVMVAGELWDSYLPPNAYAYYTEAAELIRRSFLRIGNFDRVWTTPTHFWPGGWTNGNYWAKGMEIMEYNPDPNWNPPTIGGVANPAYLSAAGGNYAFGSYRGTLPGANVASRNYYRETKWVDATKRHRALYEAGWPTNIGVDVAVKIHQFSLNWNNLNDFIIVEVTFTNTGVVDFNGDGTPERTNNVINALTMIAHGEFMCSVFIGLSGGRGANRFGAQRAIGYVGDNDPKGSPWDMMVGYPGEFAAGTKDMGLNDYPLRFYTDVWSAWSWIGAKQGSSPTPEGVRNLPDKTTIWGTPAIGTGPERGWYISAGSGRGLGITNPGGSSNPKFYHTAAMGTYYKDGGKSRDNTKFDLSPDPNFFASGTPGNPTTFVPKPVGQRARPRGDRKLLSEEGPGAFEVNTYESDWTKGFTAQNNFDGDMYSGIGPFRLEVGESMTIVWATVGGYRFRGVANAMAAARWAFENGYPASVLDNYPAVPEMRVDNTFEKSVRVRWDNRANTGPNFAGYKIYKASQAKRIDWLQTGMRVLDNYWRNTTPGPTPDNLKQPVNPNFAAQSFVAGAQGVPDSWGPYELIAVIPAAQLSQYADNSVAGYQYSYEDKVVDLGFQYWYYVAAYTSGSTYDMGPTYAGYNPASTSTIETSNVNRNGASGLWEGTYPFATLNSFFPKTAAGLKAIGAGFVVRSALAKADDIASGKTKISVKPNPYKKKALFDSAVDAFDHKVTFYNLPSPAKITILDVSGQIVQQINFSSTDPNTGSVFWNLFSKDGIEVASGLYIYVVEYAKGQHVGYLSILR